MMLKSTTRHIHIYTATVANNELVPCDDKLTLDIDPDNEFNWSEESLKAVYAECDRLVDAAAGEDLTDYNLRRIGSDLEHFVKSRALNYSMGLPRVETSDSAAS